MGSISLNPSTLLSGQGIDVSSVVQQIINAQSGPLTEWQNEASTLSTQAGLLLGINNNVTNLQTAINALSDPTGALGALSATSSQPAILTATAQGSAAAGTHQITVTNLATQSLAYTDPVSNGTLAAGGLTLQVGGGPVTTVPIASNETLSQLANDINTANLGITANVVTDANGSRLSLLSNATGQSSTLTVASAGAASAPSYSGTGNGTISGLAGGSSSVAETFTLTAIDATHFSVAGSVSGSLGTATVGTAFSSPQIGFTINQGSAQFQAGDAFTVSTTTPPALGIHQVAGTNAALNVDGIPISSASNTVSGAIPGVTLNLASAAADTPVQLTVGTDPSQAEAAVNNFISAYNTVIGNINQQYVVDPTTNTEGPLGSDISLRSLQSTLLNDAAYSVSGNSGLVNLASLGITTNDDGTLSLGLTPSGQTLSQVLAANPAAFQNFFQNVSQTGFANNFSNDLNNLTDPTQGPLNVDIAQNQVQQQALNTSISNFESQLASEQQQLTQQFNSVNASLQAYPLLLQAVTEVIGSISVSSQTGLSSTPTLTSGL
jgi:flagellar hook-associated protein 2